MAAQHDDIADLVIHGGTVVNAGGSGPGTVVVSDDRIQAVLDVDVPLPRHQRAIDATDRLVIPGGVDPHCHIGLPLGEFTTLDDYEQASVAALWGGTTTVIDFAIPQPGQYPLEAVRERREMAKGSRCDTALHGCVVEWDETTAHQMAEMVRLGVRTIKLFTTYRDVVMAGPDTVLEVLRELHRLRGMAYVHAEANHVIEDAQQVARAANEGDAAHHPRTRPELAEAAAVAQVLAIAEHVDAPVYFVHQTTPEAIDLVRDARRRGARVYTESCPHYLSLSSEVYRGDHPEKYVCCPPLRDPRTLAAVTARALTGDIDAIGSDHCCYSTKQKSSHSDDVTQMPNGLPGVETRLPMSYTRLVAEGGMPVERFVSMFATNPARLNGLRRKGVIAPGADADIAVIDPATYRVTRATDLHMASDYTPFEGRDLTGWPTVVVNAGRVVVDPDGFHDPGPVGRQLDSDELPEFLLT